MTIVMHTIEVATVERVMTRVERKDGCIRGAMATVRSMTINVYSRR